MKNAYPAILTPGSDGFTVYIPDFDIYAERKDVTNAMKMVRDAIGLAETT